MKLLFKGLQLSILMLSLTFAACSCANSGRNEDVVTDSSIMDSGVSGADSVKEPKKITFASYSEFEEYIRNSPDAAKYRQGIIPKIAGQNLKYAQKLINNTHPGFIIVDKGEMTVTLYNRFGQIDKEYKMGCAKRFGTKHKKADSRTPEGFFEAEGIYDSTDWLFTDDFGNQSKIKGQFGPRFIRIRCPKTSQIGIHGTAAPWSIGGRVSHGCIRITNENILELVKYVEPGMPIIVNPGPRDNAVNIHEGANVTMLRLGNRPDSWYNPKNYRIPHENGGKHPVSTDSTSTESELTKPLPANDSITV